MSEIIQNIREAVISTSEKMRQVIVEAQSSRDPDNGPANIFIGIGLLFKGEVSQGLSLNVLPMLCVAKELQQQLPHSLIHILIADLHALQSSRLEQKGRVIEVATQVREQTQLILNALGASKKMVKVMQASQESLFHFDVSKSSYIERQNEDIKRAHDVLGTRIKVGWQTQRQSNGSLIRDEKFFDQETLKAHPHLQSLSFIRTLEGLSTHRDKSEHIFIPPYFGMDNFQVGKEIRVQETLSSPQFKNHLARMARTLVLTLGIETRGIRSFEILQQFIDGLRGE